MENARAEATRIILVFARAIGAAMLLLAGAAMAQGSGYRLQLELDHEGRPFHVPLTSIPLGQKVELGTQPPSDVKVFVRAIGLPGAADQALLDLQVYEMRMGQYSQLASVTIPAYLGTQNSSELDTVYGKLAIKAYLDTGAAAPAPGLPAGKPQSPSRPPEPLPYAPEPAYQAPRPIP